ncbi:MAG: hypothetical protein R6V06_08840 [Kiritimatiellia bacterium]
MWTGASFQAAGAFERAGLRDPPSALDVFENSLNPALQKFHV